jgi:hypothetical protein
MNRREAIMGFLGIGRRQLTEDDIDEIAEKAAEKAVQKMTAHVYQQVGKGLVSRFLWLVGAVFIGLAAWLHTKGDFHL